jgi:hypothetical protein
MIHRFWAMAAAIALSAAGAASANGYKVSYLNQLLNDAGVSRTFYVIPGVYKGISITGQYNTDQITGSIGAPWPEFNTITLTDTPVTIFFSDVIRGDRPITLSQNSYVAFVECVFIDTPASGPDVVLNDTSRVQFELDTFTPAPAPEPGAWALMTLGAAAIGAAARARRRNRSAVKVGRPTLSKSDGSGPVLIHQELSV